MDVGLEKPDVLDTFDKTSTPVHLKQHCIWITMLQVCFDCTWLHT